MIKYDFLFKKWPKLSKYRNSAFQIYSNFLCWKEFSWCILLMPISVEFRETAGTSNCFGEFPQFNLMVETGKHYYAIQ